MTKKVKMTTSIDAALLIEVRREIFEIEDQ